MHEHFWSLLIKIFIITIVIAIIPLTTSIMGISVVSLENSIALLFPVASFLLAFYGAIILMSEEKEIEFIRNQIHNINKNMKKDYQCKYDDMQNKTKCKTNSKKHFLRLL